ncbi:MAG: aminoglycoside phosphotransferase family protein [Anaerolineae bacterium]
MTHHTLHADEVPITQAIVTGLINQQFPQWSDLPLEPFAAMGTDHVLYRLGEDLLVRLPRLVHTSAQVIKEYQWLPKLAIQLPLAIPSPIALGQSNETYPFQWAVYGLLAGEVPAVTPYADDLLFAERLAQFMNALQRIDTTGAPQPGAHNFGRGVPLRDRDAQTRQAIQSLAGMIDTTGAMAIWENALNAPVWDKPPVWIHGDLQAGNLLVDQGNLHAVIDFGGLAIGDPACDLQVAWNFLGHRARAHFRQLVGLDDASWLRGKGWALSIAVIALPYYLNSNPHLVAISQRAISALLEGDHSG